MTQQTPLYSLPYLTLNDPPDIAGSEQALAVAVETAIDLRDHRTLAEIKAGSSASTSTSTIADKATVNLVQGRRYKATWSCEYKGANPSGGPYPNFTMRYIAGATLAVDTGTVFRMSNIDVTDLAKGLTMVGTFTAPTTGQYTVGVQVNGNGQTITIPIDGNNDRLFLLEDIGL